MKCADKCKKTKVCCSNTDCRLWIDYEEDLNCTIITARNNEGGLNLREIGKRLKLSAPRVKQIQDGAFKKLKNKILNMN